MVAGFRRTPPVTIQVAAGHYAYTAPITCRHPCAGRIAITGEPAITGTLTTGYATGNQGSDTSWGTGGVAAIFQLALAGNPGAAVGDVLVFSGLSGQLSGNACGAFRVLSASGNLVNMSYIPGAGSNYAFPGMSPSGSYALQKTVLTFSGCNGFVFDSAGPAPSLSNLAIMQTGLGVNAFSGIIASNGAVVSLDVARTVSLGEWGGPGIMISTGANVVGSVVITKCNQGNGRVILGGAICVQNARCTLSAAIFTGNYVGAFVTEGSSVDLTGSYFGSQSVDFYVGGGSTGIAKNAVFLATAYGNPTAMFAEYNATIMCMGYTFQGSHNTNPALNTLSTTGGLVSDANIYTQV